MSLVGFVLFELEFTGPTSIGRKESLGLVALAAAEKIEVKKIKMPNDNWPKNDLTRLVDFLTRPTIFCAELKLRNVFRCHRLFMSVQVLVAFVSRRQAQQTDVSPRHASSSTAQVAVRLATCDPRLSQTAKVFLVAQIHHDFSNVTILINLTLTQLGQE